MSTIVSRVEVITYQDYLDVCRANGFEYTVIGRRDYIPFIDFFEFRSHTVSIPCRDLKSGRNLINDFKSDGIGGHFYIRKISFPEDPILMRIKNWLKRYK